MDRFENKAKTIVIKGKSKKEFFLLHGYSGSPTDFNDLGRYLNERFDATVKIIRLKGHGERIENIDHLNYSDFLSQAEHELSQDIEKNEIILGGLSVGSFLALNLSAKYPIKGILNISVPYTYKIFSGILAFFEPIILKKHWKKPMSKEELRIRKNAFYYGVNLNGIRIVKQGMKSVDKILHKITVPCLFVHSDADNVFDKKGMNFLADKIKSKKKKALFLKMSGFKTHNPFYSKDNKKLYKIIGDFVEENCFWQSK